MADETETTTMYVKSIPKKVSEDVGRCAKREQPEPMTLAGYIEHVHGFYQARKGMAAVGPTIGADGREAPASMSSHSGAELLHAKAAFFESLATVTEKVRGNGVLARQVRHVLMHQLAEYAPEMLPGRPAAAPRKTLTIGADAAPGRKT